MSFERKMQEGLTVMGLSTRASNDEAWKIGDVWRQFHAMGDQAMVAARLDETVYCVYCEYAGDASQPFTVVVGCAVPPDAETPEGLKRIEVEAGEFAVFPVAESSPMGVLTAWSEIWRTPLARRYQSDFDRYAPDGTITVNVRVG